MNTASKSNRSTEPSTIPTDVANAARVLLVINTIFADGLGPETDRTYLEYGIAAADAGLAAFDRMGGDKWALINALQAHFNEEAKRLGGNADPASAMVDAFRTCSAWPGDVAHEAINWAAHSLSKDSKDSSLVCMAQVACLASWSYENRGYNWRHEVAWQMVMIAENLADHRDEGAAADFIAWLRELGNAPAADVTSGYPIAASAARRTP